MSHQPMRFHLTLLFAMGLILSIILSIFVSQHVAHANPEYTHSLMRVYTGHGKLSVFLNGKKIGDYKGLTNISVDPYVKSGQNTLKVVWADKTFGNVKIAHARTKNDFKDVTKLEILHTDGKEAGSETVTFLLPEKK